MYKRNSERVFDCSIRQKKIVTNLILLVTHSRFHGLCRPKKHGGLAIKDIKSQNIALLARWASYVVTKEENEWTKLYIANLELLHWKGK